MNRKIVLFPLALAAILGLASCSNDKKPTTSSSNGGGTVSSSTNSTESTEASSSDTSEEVKASITVDKEEVTIEVGDSELVTATVKNATNTNKTWTSSDETVATVAAGTITGVKEGTATITVTLDSDPTIKAEVAVTVTKKTNKVTETTVDNLASTSSGLTAKTLYRATGIIEKLDHSDQYGNAYLTDPTSGKTVQIYGLTGTDDESCFNFEAAKDSQFFSNPKDAKTSLADVSNGQLVTVKVGWCKFGAGTEIFGILEKKEDSTAKYGVNISTFEHGTATSDKAEYSYGEKVTLTITPEAEYVVDSLTVKDAQSNSVTTVKESENVYSFNATCVNEVTITLKSSADTKTTVIWDCSSNSAPATELTTDTEFTATVGSLGEVKFGGTHVKQNTGYIMMYSKNGDSYLYSKEALPGSIVSISIKTGSAASNDATYAVHFGFESIATINKNDAVNITTGSEYRFECAVENAKYFQITSAGSTKNGQLATVTIVYDTAA